MVSSPWMPAVLHFESFLYFQWKKWKGYMAAPWDWAILGWSSTVPGLVCTTSQLDCPFLPLSAAQLDSIGFNIIRKCIHAVETRGKVVQQMALFSVKVTHLVRWQTWYLLFPNFKWLINSPNAIGGVFPQVLLLWSAGALNWFSRQPLRLVRRLF